MPGHAQSARMPLAWASNLSHDKTPNIRNDKQTVCSKCCELCMNSGSYTMATFRKYIILPVCHQQHHGNITRNEQRGIVIL